MIVAPDGHVDVLYDAHPTDRGTDAVHPGHEYFTSSADGTRWPAAPRPLWPGQGTLSLPAWWIDGDLSADAAGNLYATWDTQTAAGDIGWLTWSRDGGSTWSAPVRVTPDQDRAPHIVESAGGRPGEAYIAWQTSGGGPGLRHLPAPVLHHPRLAGPGGHGVRRLRQRRRLARGHLRHRPAARR